MFIFEDFAKIEYKNKVQIQKYRPQVQYIDFNISNTKTKFVKTKLLAFALT